MSNKVEEMKDSEHTLLPILRFPEFKKTNKWESSSISHIATFFKGRGISKADVVDGGLTPCIRYAELYTIYGEIINEIQSHTNIPISELVLSHSEDVILPSSGETRADIARASCVLRKGVALGGDINILRSDLNGTFFSYLLNSPLRYKIARVAQGDTIAHLYPNQVSRVVIKYPSLPEQKKIANCLSSLDDLITAENQKLETLKVYKKGLMQKLFPQLGQTQPRLRFPEFREKGEWQETTVGKKCTSFSGSTPDTKREEYYGGTIPFIRSAEIGSDNTELLMTEEGYNNSSAKIVVRGDVLVALYGANSGDVAIARIDGAINQAILCLRPDGNKAFLYHYLTHKKDWIIATYLQGGQGNLSGEIVKSVTLRYPLLEEQETVAFSLTSIDDQISAQVKKIENLKQHKRGLMQQLFPASEE